MNDASLVLRVGRVADAGGGARLFELRAVDGGDLPSFQAGAHIDLELGAGMIRQYSLLNDPDETDRYVIAVAREPASRGGSIWLHDNVAEGDILQASPPRNHFPLEERARHSVLVAGGIGITPIWSMVQRLARLGRSWELHYAARDRTTAALVEQVEALGKGGHAFYFSREPGGRRLDVGDVVWNAPPETHFYCCGPAPMLDAFREACRGLPPEFVHFEQFTPAAPAATDGNFTVVLARSGREVVVRAGETVLDALKREGLRATFSCMEGVCGSCETPVLEGLPDHRDAVLTDAERAAGKTMMICCSGSLTDRLVLDI